MAKKVKGNVIPAIYAGIDTNNTLLHRCLIEDVDGNFSVFSNEAQLRGLKSYEELIKPTIVNCWPTYESFCDLPEQKVLTYHANVFGAEPPKDQDKVTTAVYTWKKLVMQAKNQCADTTTKDPVTGRNSTIGNCKYMRGLDSDGNLTDHTKVVIKTPQAQACFKIFSETLEKVGEGEGNDRFITEAVFKQAINDRAAEIRTRQDPWRIFQYYRSTLINMRLMRRQ